MNYFSHLHVARCAGFDGAEHALGTMLPDLASVAQVRVDPALLPPEVARGRRLHHRADTLFHRCDRFLDLVADLRALLGDADVGGGPGRAIAHLGTELLLDGVLPGTAALQVAYRAAMDASPLVVPALEEPDRARWHEAVRWLSGAVPSDYAEPAEVARRVHRVLARRPRLAFGASSLPRVAMALGAHRPAVAGAAEGVVAEVVAGVAPDRP